MDIEHKKLLIVDDDPALRGLLERYLTEQNYIVASAEDGMTMDNHLASHEVDLIVLDLMLPGEDGLSIARRLKASTNIPILILSARGEEIDRIVGLEMGADDYLPKPFNPRELVARIRAVLRRQDKPDHDEEDQSPKHKVYDFDGFTLDITTHQLSHDGEDVTLTSGEFDLLKAFVEHPNRVLSRDTLVDLLKGFDRSPYDRSIDVRVTRLRRKMEADPAQPLYIRTIWGEGYMFTPDQQSAVK
ncbi:MAG: Two-component system response regulator OmpR [uncultured Thiotrichaceae bacterium]|uniref:Two-component system response regulator OmpR n=1 Tax=uncultured Thiotrichaceae bacterium TaxID=298394 RepID=A0A6S6TPL1_9GAMM|nr:MAG: Two-component system response regulator OmpR [uncultured Thiotrichaceae bacterium]